MPGWYWTLAYRYGMNSKAKVASQKSKGNKSHGVNIREEPLHLAGVSAMVGFMYGAKNLVQPETCMHIELWHDILSKFQSIMLSQGRIVENIFSFLFIKIIYVEGDRISYLIS